MNENIEIKGITRTVSIEQTNGTVNFHGFV